MKQLKLALAFVLTAVMLLGCGTVAFAEGATDTAQAPGLDETVTVTITVEDGVITAAEAVTDKAEETVGRQALTDLPAAMVEKNSIAVDGVSGAAAASNAVLTAAAQAYLQALGLDVDLDAWAQAAGYRKGRRGPLRLPLPVPDELLSDHPEPHRRHLPLVPERL